MTANPQTLDLDYLRTWIGRRETTQETLATAPMEGLAAVLDHPRRPWPAQQIAPLGHWLYFLPHARQSEIDVDGHPQRGGFLPPVSLPRRMWAGSTLTFQRQPNIGETLHRVSTIEGVQGKSGKSGQLLFVSVRHQLYAGDEPLLSEAQDIVYREAAGAVATQAAIQADVLPPLDWQRELRPDPVLLMRFSALTFNAHRIHYDRDYARDHEGYAGLVVHGPLTASLLLDLFLREHPGAVVSRFSFQGRRPLLDTGPLRLVGRAVEGGAQLWALDEHGRIGMSAELEAR
ncbi:3-methylfumaryl-CoA hydratase [Pseudomonas flavescens]|uniref:3-methylfumaryl-CoA hydratase n=1 Tax=Phytopseudomonas flavescens TaxID=29435 RepID=A0A1G7Y3S3_9GAMM|nr:MaoC family dehydratase N-terminal domain-containing protein [Pseudomonas flavescens]SDG91108.1 3-methylfumaryl-CoA hydratase [Pseudomonas flavescens]